MANEPQRDIEQDLLAYKQRRGEQAGPPLELHPATRKMLQGEVARTTGRPLLTSEEAAKNFVRSFVMSHQQPGFFARHRHRVIWGGAMFACLTLVLAVLRNDPQRKASERAFPDALPTPTPLPGSDLEFKPPQPIVAANDLKSAAAINASRTETERLSRDKRELATVKSVENLTKLSAAPVSGPVVNNPRPPAAPSTPVATVQREVDRRSAVVAPAMPTGSAVANGVRAAGEPAPTAGRAFLKTDSNLARTRSMDADEKSLEKAAAGERGLVLKALKDGEVSEAKAVAEVRKAKEETKLAVGGDAMKRAPLTAATAGAGGGLAPAPAPTAAPMPASAARPLNEALSFGAAGGGGAAEASLRQQFQQVDSRAPYRQNFNSPPVPEVMKDFAFERTGDRVRIVDADGSTYEGTVLPTPTEDEVRAKKMAVDAVKQTNGALGLKPQSASQAGQTAADQPLAYRFTAQGVNRKLKQSVEFRGEWQPAPPPQPAPATPALLPTSYGTVRLEAQAAEKKEKAITNTLADSPVAAKGYLSLQLRRDQSQGRISGRAVVGGKEEFEIKAVTK